MQQKEPNHYKSLLLSIVLMSTFSVVATLTSFRPTAGGQETCLFYFVEPKARLLDLIHIDRERVKDKTRSICEK